MGISRTLNQVKESPLTPEKGNGLLHNHYLWVGVAFLILTLLYTGRMWVSIGSAMPGGNIDGYENFWNNWWVRYALLDRHVNPYFNDFIYYPLGVSLRLHTLQPLNSLFTIPLAPLFGLIAATNLTLVWAVFANAFFSYLFLYYLCQNTLAAFVGASFFGFCNSQIYEFFGAGQANLVAVEWLPLYLLFMFKVGRGEGKRWLNIVIAAVLLLCLNLTDLQYLLFAVVLTGLYAVYSLFQNQSWREKGWVWGRFALVGTLYGMVALPLFIIPTIIESANSPWLWPSADQSLSKATGLFDYLGWEGRNLGYIPLILAIIGLLASWRKNTGATRFLAIAALVFGLVSLGPALQWDNAQPLKLGDFTLSLPYAWISALPGMQVGRNASLFQIVWYLAVAGLAGYGLMWLIERFARGWLWHGQLALSGAVVAVAVGPLLIGAAGSYKLDFLEVPPFYQQLAQDKADYAIYEIPAFTESGLGEDVYQAYQVYHGKPRLGGRYARDHKLSNPNNFVKTNTLFRDFYWLTTGNIMKELRPDRDFLSAPDYKSVALPLLNYYKIGYLVIYKEALDPAGLKYATDLAKQILPDPRPTYEDARMLAYKVPTAAPLTQNSGVFADVGDGWYKPETQNGETWRWAKSYDKADLYLYNLGQESKNAKLNLTAYSFKKNRDLIVKLNGQEIKRLSLVEERQKFSLDLKLAPGRNFLTFSSPDPGLAVADFGFKNDSRVLSFGMLNLSLEQSQ